MGLRKYKNNKSKLNHFWEADVVEIIILKWSYGEILWWRGLQSSGSGHDPQMVFGDESN
jgi:hypothetical protein